MSTSSKKSPIFLEDVDIDNISVSNKISLDKKNALLVTYDYKIKPLHIILLKTCTCVKKIMMVKLNDDVLKKMTCWKN